MVSPHGFTEMVSLRWFHWQQLFQLARVATFLHTTTLQLFAPDFAANLRRNSKEWLACSSPC